MITTSSIVEHGVTEHGQFYEKHEVSPGRYFLRTTRDSGRFTTWLNWNKINDEAEAQMKPIIDSQRATLIEMIEQVAKSCGGRFNKELYLKIIEAKRKNGTIFW